ncbi:MAG: hypothetical protein M5U28_31805 [Sandaracinaceae bacterium]|nr:hypothetical protein [Sandaracinaceae bacterium]
MAVSWVLCVGCGESVEPVGDASAPRADAAMDAAREDAGERCARDLDCDDGMFCDGEERCDPEDPDADGRGCVSGAPACGADPCDEASRSCDTTCATPDADGDGHAQLACAGDDCADDDADRFPGNSEVCDADDHDEDCDPGTFGDARSRRGRPHEQRVLQRLDLRRRLRRPGAGCAP